MAKNFMSTILDELMGRDRNAGPDEQPKKISWDDPEVCSHYLVSFCPHELFVNTKADLGPCPKLHDDQMRKKYQDDAPNNRKLQFESEFIRFAEKMIQDIEAKIKRGKMRIALANGPDGGTYAGPGSKNAEKIALLTERINVLLKETEEAGCEGDIEKAQGLLKLCDQLKEEREQMKSNEVSHPWNPDKAMQVCEVCGSYLIIGEAQHRLDDHIMGKQHVGFAMLRKTMDDVKKAKETREKEDRERIEKERLERRYGGVGRNSGPPGRSIDKKDRREKSRSRSRESRDRKKKDEKRRKSRSTSPRRRSRSRDRKDRHKDRKDDRKRGRDSSRDKKSRKDSDDKKRSKRSRSRSRDRHRRKSRSTSRDKDRNKDRSHSRKHKEREKDRDRNNSDHKDKEKLAETTAGSAGEEPPVKSPKLESPVPQASPQITGSDFSLAEPSESHIGKDNDDSMGNDLQEAAQPVEKTSASCSPDSGADGIDNSPSRMIA